MPMPDVQDEDNRESTNMPRRSRRSPRHLRVSGQRRRRYRDERYPGQSPMPVTVAAASPEMASGKVWISYPVAQADEPAQQVEQHSTPDYQAEETAAAVALPATDAVPVAAAEAEPVKQAEPQVETVVPVVAAEETAAIDVPVNEQPSVISAADEATAQTIAAQAEPADVNSASAAEAPVAETQPVASAAEQPQATASDVAQQSAADVSPRVEQQVEEVLAAPVAATEAPVVTEPHAPVPARDEPVNTAVAATSFKLHATAPMTKAPAPAWQPEPVRQSDWQRPAYDFEGKGAAGGHSATHHATAPATRP